MMNCAGFILSFLHALTIIDFFINSLPSTSLLKIFGDNMDIFEALFTRRSIRSFTEETVNDADVKRMLEAAMVAPSAGNAQPWRFIVVRDKAALTAIADTNPYAAMAKQASVCIVVCADLQAEKYPGYWQQDCAAALQNILLAARGMNIGTVWTGVYPDKERAEKFKEFFALPEHAEVLGIVVCGHPKQEFKARDNFDATKVFTEHWGK